MLANIYKKIWTKLFNRFFKLKYQRENQLRTNSRPSPLIFIAVSLIWSTITSIKNAKTILPLLELPSQTKFYLQLFFLGLNQFLLTKTLKKTRKR